MNFIGTFWALIPAIIAIVIALKTKEVYISLFIGIFVGGLLLTGFQPIACLLYTSPSPRDSTSSRMPSSA